MKRQSAAYLSDVTFSTCFQHLQCDGHLLTVQITVYCEE
jgi:hypothetical protein